MVGAPRSENVSKRAEELEAMHMEAAALDASYETVVSKRTRAMPLDQLEPVFAKFSASAVQSRRGKVIKDGLHQYRKLVIAAAGEDGVEMLERAVTDSLERSTKAVAAAQTKADQQEQQHQAKAEVDDSDEEGPQDLMLALVSNEESKDRTDRELVTPWLKFLWENYRSVLDVSRNNSKLEGAYARAASAAFRFCAEHNRKTEFRRLAELLRTHLQHAAAQSSTYHADSNAARSAAVEQLAQQQGISTAAALKEVTPEQIAHHMPQNAPQYPIDSSDADTLQRFSDTRFEQLEQAVKLESWQETYRSIEDVHTLLSATRRPIPVSSMATYYETSARVFAVSQNHSFHAATWFRYFAMSSSRRAPEAESSRIASFCVSSSSCVAPSTSPLVSANRGSSSTNDAAHINGRTRRWMNLINSQRSPTREMLVDAALARNVIGYVSPESRQSFNSFQPANFNALTSKSEIARLAPYLSANAREFAPYFKPMLEVAAVSVFGALAQAYTEASLDFVLGLVSFPAPSQADTRELERSLVRSSSGSLSADSGYLIRIDHTTGAHGIVRFVDSLAYPLAGTAGALVRNESYELARSSTRATTPARDAEAELAAHGPAGSGSRQLSTTEARAALITEKREYQARVAREAEREKTSREESSRSEEERHRERVRKAEEARALAEAKAAEEEAKQAAESLEKEWAAVELEEKRKLAQSINSKGHVQIDMDNLENTTREQSQKMQVEQVEQETRTLDARMAAVARRHDHLERASRQEESKSWREEAENQRARDREIYDKRVEALMSGSRRVFEEGQAYAERFARSRGQFHAFTEQSQAAHNARVAESRAKNDESLAKAKADRIEKHAEAKRSAEERERAEREQREAQRIADEKRRVEEAARQESERQQREEAERARQERSEASRQKAEQMRRELAEKRAATGAPSGSPSPRASPAPAGASPFGRAAPAATGTASPFGRAAGRPAAAAPSTASPAPGPGPVGGASRAASGSNPFGRAAGTPAGTNRGSPAPAPTPASSGGKYVPAWKRAQQNQ